LSLDAGLECICVLFCLFVVGDFTNTADYQVQTHEESAVTK